MRPCPTVIDQHLQAGGLDDVEIRDDVIAKLDGYTLPNVVQTLGMNAQSSITVGTDMSPDMITSTADNDQDEAFVRAFDETRTLPIQELKSLAQRKLRHRGIPSRQD
jgi:hypothetical protein